MDRDSASTATQADSEMTRRGVMRRAAIGIGAAAGASAYGLSGRGPGSPVGGAEALAPVVIYGAAAGGSIALGWALREFEVIGADSPTDGLGPDALHTDVYQTARTRESTNASTIVDNRNILDGIENTAYIEGKLAAIEKLNNETSLETVQTAAEAAAASYVTTIQKNFLKSWNESLNELNTLSVAVEDSSASHKNVFIGKDNDSDSGYNVADLTPGTETATLADGTSFDVKNVEIYHSHPSISGGFSTYSPLSASLDEAWSPPLWIGVSDPDGSENVQYLYQDVWQGMWSDLKGAESGVLGGLQTWTANVYESVQAGDIEISDLVTPRERAAMLSDDEEFPQAVADLIALNIPVDPDREATIHLTDRDITLTGLMAPTSPPADGFVVGQSYDPTSAPWDLYFTYDPSKGSGGWTAYETTISEGTLVFTSEPYEASVYEVPTNGGTVEVTTSEFSATGSGTWTANVSDQLEIVETDWTNYQTAIDGGTVTFTSLPAEPAEFDIVATDGDSETVTAAEFTDNGDGTYSVSTGLGISEVDSVTARIERWSVSEDGSVSVRAEDGSAGYETVQIQEPFTLEKLEDSEGNTYGQTEFTQTEAQTDSNYITQEEWNQLEQQNQELINTYEEQLQKDQTSIGGGGGGFLSGGGDVKTLGIVAGGAALAALLFGNN